MRKKKRYRKIKSLLAGMMAMLLLLQIPLGYVVQAEDTVAFESSGENMKNLKEPGTELEEPGGQPEEEPALTEPEAEKKEPEVQPEGEAEQKPQAEEAAREPIDWSADADAMKISLEKITAGETAAAEPELQNEVFDLSAADISQGIRFEVSVELQGLPEDGKMLAQDTVTLSLPAEQWNLTDVDEPVPLYTYGREDYESAGMDAAKSAEIGSYVIRANELKITFNEAVQELPAFFSVLSFEGTLQEGIQETELIMALQPDRQVKVILPKAPEEEKTDSEGQGQPEEVKENQAEVKKEEPEAAADQKEPAPGTESKEESGQPEEKTGIRERIGSLFRKAANVFNNDTREVDKEYYQNAVKSKHIFTGEELPDGFDTVKLTVQSREGGYSKDEPDAYVNMAYSVFMDEDFLFLKSEEFMKMTSFPKQGSLSDEEWLAKVKLWLDGQSGETVPALVYTYDLGELFTGYSQEKKELYNAGNDTEMIGEYEIENGVLKVTMNSLLYFMNDITFSFNFDAALDTSRLGDDPQEVVVGDDGKLIHQSSGTAGGGTGGTDTPDYVLEKEAPVKVSDTTITYHLTVSAKDKKYLNGKLLTDAMPQASYGGKNYKLKVVSLMRKGASGSFDQKVNYTLDSEGGISYQFEALNKEQTNQVKEAEFELVLELDEASYQNLITQGNIKLSFTNQASLQEEGNTDPAAVSEAVPTKMEMSFIGKQGKEANLEGTRYAWTVDLNTKLSSMKAGYGFLVDTICETDHTYDMEHGVEITADGRKAQVLHPEKKTVNSPVAWEDLTAENLHDMMAENGITDAFYYVYDVTDTDGNKIANPFYGQGSDTSEFVQRAVLVIPFDQYRGPKEDGTSRAVTMKYLTDLNRHGLDSKTYLDILAAHPEYTQEIKNQVNLLWENEGGTGPGPVPQDEVDFGKRVDTDIDAVHKEGVSYNPAAKMAEWAVDVNKLGISLENVVLTDRLTDDQGNRIYDTDQIKITYYRYYNGNHSADESGNLEMLAKEPAGDELNSAFGYRVEADGNLKIYLGDLSGDGTSGYLFYKLSIQMPVTDEGILSSQSRDQSRSNQIALSAIHGGVPYSGSSEADLTMPNTLIEKSAEEAYDYKTHKLGWSIAVNPEKVNIQKAVVTDTVQPGFTYGGLTAVEKNGTSDSAMFEKLKGQSASGQEIVWNMGDIGENTYTLRFTTEASEEWRNNNLICPTDAQGNLTTDSSVEVPNHVKLEGMVNGTRQITNAEADAAHTIEKIPLSKKGTLDEDTGEIKWTILVNQDQYNLSGMYLTEKLTSVHELDPDSVKIVTIDKDGKETADDTGALTDLDVSGFTYTFPDNKGDNYQTYKLTFSTYLTEEAEDSDASISNQVYLKDKAGDYEEVSKPDDGGFHGGFDFANAASASKRPKIALRKVSSNSISPDGEKEGSLGLSAEFSLSGYKYQYDSANKKLTVLDSSPVSKYDKTRIVEGGDASFLNINPSDEIIYVLAEEEALDGYEKTTAKPEFLYFPKSQSTDISGDVETVSYQGKEYTSEYKRIEPDSYKNGGVPETVTVTNTPADMEFEFTKLQVKQSSYENSQTNQTKEYEPSKSVIFKAEPQGSLSGKVKTRYAKSDTNGKLKFENLDPGDYRLTEISSEDNIVSGGTVMLHIGFTKENGYEYTFSRPTGGISIDETDQTILKDELLTGSFAFTKYVQYVDKAAGTEASKEALEGISFYLEGKTKGSTGQKNFYMTAASGADGKVEFRNIPAGSYTVYENPAKGYTEYQGTAQPVPVYTVEVSDVPTSAKLGEYEGTTYYGKKAEAEVTVTRTGTDSKTEVHNTAVKGSISLTKLLSEDVLSSLHQSAAAGAQFGLYRKIGTKEETSPVYKGITEDDGSLTFADVEYGNYILKEMKAPDGYDNSRLAAPVEITREMLAVGFDSTEKPEKFTYLITGAIENSLYKTQVPFVKKDSDGNALAGIEFSLYRRNPRAIGSDGAGFTASVDAAVHDYWAYAPMKSVTSGVDGTFSLDGIPYGDYLMIETNEPADLQDGHSKEALHISITESEVKVIENEDFAKDAQGDCYRDVDLQNDQKWVEVEKEDGNYKIVNQRKYAYVQLYKTAGESAGGIVTADTSARLAGARFEILKGGNHYLTVESDGNGRIVPVTSGEHEGSYEDLDHRGSYRRLFYDDTYQIREVKAPEGYKINGTAVNFVISEDTTGHEGSAWISLNESDHNVIYTKSGGRLPEIENAAVVNERQRGTFTLQKEDLDGNVKTGALFGIYSQDKLIAVMKETGAADQRYHAANEDLDGNRLDARNADNLAYLHFNGTEYAVLPGIYQVKEITAPQGYEVAADVTLSITEKQDQSGVDVAVSGNDRADIDTDCNITLRDEPIEVNIKKTGPNGENLTGAEFAVTGKFADKTEGTKTFADAASGQLVAGNEYLLKETKAPDGYILSAESIRFTVEKDGTLTIADGKNTAEIDSTKKDTIVFKDDPIDITLKKIDGFDQTTVIPGVSFMLKDQSDGSESGPFTTEADGTLKIPGLVGGHTYTLKETNAPDHYAAGQKITFTVETDGTLSGITAGGSTDEKKTTLIVENKPVNASVRLKKVDAVDGSGIGETSFRLTKEGEPAGTIYKTQSEAGKAEHLTSGGQKEEISLQKGELFITGLEKGKYTLEETDANDNYELGTDPFIYTFTVDDSWGSGKILEIQPPVPNDRKTGTVELTKKGQPDQNETFIPLNGAEFTLYYAADDSEVKDADGRVVKAVTDNDGLAKITDLAWNTYYLKETKAPDGYVAGEEKLVFTIGYGELAKAFSQVSGGSDVVNKATVFTIRKTDLNGNGLTGAQFTMTGRFADSRDAETVRTYDMSAVSNLTVYRELIAGETYKLTEIKAPDGYELSKDLTVTVLKDGKISVNGTETSENVIQVKDEKIETGLRKTDPDGNTLSGGIYAVRPAQGSRFAEESQDSLTVTEETMKEVLSGKLLAENQYVLKETKAPDGYELAGEVIFQVDENGKITLPGNPEFAAVDSKDGKLPVIVLQDQPIGLAFVKLSEEQKELDGAEFTVAGVFAKFPGENQAPEEITAAPGESGKLTARFIAGNTYTVKETTEPDGYVKLAGGIQIKAADDGTFTILSDPDQAAVLSAEKDQLKITDRQTKFSLDKISNEPGADGSIVHIRDAVLEIRQKDGSPVRGRTWTSDGEHKGEITGLKKGEYQLVETKTPYGYVTAEPIPFVLHEDNTVTLTGSEGEVEKDSDGNAVIVMTDTVIRAQAELTKTRIDLDGKAKTALEGAVFDLYRQKGENPDSDKDTLIARDLLTGDDGTWTTKGNETVRVDNPAETLAKGLTEGKYYFRETMAPKSAWLDAKNQIWSFGVGSDEHQSTVKTAAKNQAFQANAVLKKVDQTSKEALSKVEFTLLEKSSDGQWDVKETRKTDEKGEVHFTLYEKGEYQITETGTAAGYQLAQDAAYTAEFTVDDRAYGKTLELKEDISAEEQEIFKPAVANALYADGVIANERIPGRLTLSKADGEDQTSLDGVTFSLYQKKEKGYSKIGEFLTGRRYVKASDGTWDQETAEQGTLTIEGLDWGEYYIQESESQSGYILSDEKYEFAVGRLDQEVILSVDKGTIENARTRVYFYKSGRVMEDCADGTLDGVPDAGYSIPLAGSEFTAYTEKECKNAVMTAVSDKNGKVEFVKLPGDAIYYIRETKASDGYLLNEEVFRAVLDDHGQYVSFTSADGNEIADLNVVNDVKRTDIVLKKVSEQDPSNTIPGSVYGLYKKTEQVPKEEMRLLRASVYAASAQDEWTLIAQATTDKDGILTFAGVLMNTEYMIRELKEPDGSHISKQPVTITFGVDENGKTVITEISDGGKTAEVDPVTGEIIWHEPSIVLEFAKKDTDGKLLGGAELKLVDADGNTVDRWTSSGKEPHVIYGDQMDGKIAADREYTLVEEKAPEGYLTAEPVTFTVETKATGPMEGFVQTIEMIDEKIPVKPGEPKPEDPAPKDPLKPMDHGGLALQPKDPVQTPADQGGTKAAKSVQTGDQDSMAVYVILMIGAALAAGGFIAKRRRKTK